MRGSALITATSLKEYTYKDLAQLAKKQGIRGWHAMRKDELVRALARASKQSTRSSTNGGAHTAGRQRTTSANRKGQAGPNGKRTVKTRNRRVQQVIDAEERLRDLAQPPASAPKNKDRQYITEDKLILMVRDPFWLHVFWQITPASVQRARAALAEFWHGASPILRLLTVDDAAASNMAETIDREIEVHSGVNHWYIDLKNPPGTYRVEIGYRGTDGRFYAVARSNVVSTPTPGGNDAVDENWTGVAADCEKIFARSGGSDKNGKGMEVREILEERLRRPMGSPVVTRYGAGAERLLRNEGEFKFEVDCELIVYGITNPDAYVTLSGDPVTLRPDGTFTVRMQLPNRRQVIPVVSDSSDGLQQQTIVLALERNTKSMEPVIRDPDD